MPGSEQESSAPGKKEICLYYRAKELAKLIIIQKNRLFSGNLLLRYCPHVGVATAATFQGKAHQHLTQLGGLSGKLSRPMLI